MKKLLIFSLAIAITSISRAQGSELNSTTTTSRTFDAGITTSYMGNLFPAYGASFQLSRTRYKEKSPNLNTGMKVTWGRIDIMFEPYDGPAFRLSPVQIGYMAQFEQNTPERSWELGFSAGPSLTYNRDMYYRSGMFQFFTKSAGVNFTPELRYNIYGMSFSASYDYKFGIMLGKNALYQEHTIRLGVGIPITKK